MDFYLRVKELVKKKNITIDALMKDCFGSTSTRSTFNTWQKRETYPRADDAVRIAQYLGVSVEYLVLGNNQNSSPEAKFVESNQEMKTLVQYCMNDHQLLPALKIIMGQSHPGKRQ